MNGQVFCITKVVLIMDEKVFCIKAVLFMNSQVFCKVKVVLLWMKRFSVIFMNSQGFFSKVCINNGCKDFLYKT